MSSIGAWLQRHADLSRLDLEVLLGHALHLNRSQIIAFPERSIDCAALSDLEQRARRLREGEPVAYLTGTREFYGLEFEVSPDVLIPRNDTETLVEAALTRLSPGTQVLDLGTGSGCIAICLAKLGGAVVTAVDRSAAALRVAKTNAGRLRAEITFLESDWFESVTNRFAIIVSNPPYVAANDSHLPALTHEPTDALIAGADGLDDLRRICSAAPDYLLDDGCLLLEHGFDQGDQVRKLLSDAGFTDVATLSDLSGNDRVSVGLWRTP